MLKRTTIEIDQQLLSRAKQALGRKTARETVEEALRQVAEAAEGQRAERAARQEQYLKRLSDRADLSVLKSSEMWR